MVFLSFQNKKKNSLSSEYKWLFFFFPRVFPVIIYSDPKHMQTKHKHLTTAFTRDHTSFPPKNTYSGITAANTERRGGNKDAHLFPVVNLNQSSARRRRPVKRVSLTGVNTPDERCN